MKYNIRAKADPNTKAYNRIMNRLDQKTQIEASENGRLCYKYDDINEAFRSLTRAWIDYDCWIYIVVEN